MHNANKLLSAFSRGSKRVAMNRFDFGMNASNLHHATLQILINTRGYDVLANKTGGVEFVMMKEIARKNKQTRMQ